MIHSQNTIHETLINPQSVGTTAVTGVIDTLGMNHLEVLALLDTAATTVTITTLKLAEGDTTSAYTDITEFTGGTAAGNFTLPVGPGTAAGTGQIIALDVDLRKRKRYLRVSLANSAGRLSSVKATGTRHADYPVTDSARGCAIVVEG
jgi:hypothetical protein